MAGRLDKKQVLEILRVSATFLSQNQIALRNNLFPFIILSVLGFVFVFPGQLHELTEKFAPKDPESPVSVVFGIPVTPLVIALGLLVIFMRFGFLLFHGLDLACSNKALIVKSGFSAPEELVLLQSFKDAYLIDTFLIFLNKPTLSKERNIIWKRLSAIVVNILLLTSLLISQILVISIFYKFKYVYISLLILYAALFLIFSMKLRDIYLYYYEISEENKTIANLIIYLYFLSPFLSLAASFLSILVIGPHYQPTRSWIDYLLIFI